MKSYTVDITIAIVTKNRVEELDKCIKSIFNQTVYPKEILILDNDKDKTAKAIQKKYSSLNKNIKVRYINKLGTVPKCRNLAIKNSSTEFLGFVDDDCILKSNWLKEGMTKVKVKKLDYVLGKTELLNKKNLYAIAQYSRDLYWKIYNKKIFDTKNVIINIKKINKNNLKFDESCQSEIFDSADYDFDFQIKAANLSGMNCQKMIAWHKETNSFKRFTKRAYHRGKLSKYINKKWNLSEDLFNRWNDILILWLIKTIKNFKKEYLRYSSQIKNENVIKKILIVFLIKIFDLYYAKGYCST